MTVTPAFLDEYLIERAPLRETEALIPREEPVAVLSFESIWIFMKEPPENSDNEWPFEHTVQVVTRRPHTDNLDCLRIRGVESSFSVPGSAPSRKVFGGQLPLVALDIPCHAREFGWVNPTWMPRDLQWIEVAFSLRFWRDESTHEWTERILNARLLIDNLALAGLDVKDDLKRLFD